jgi:Zn-dependent peptidase ImmA (M78 family)/transcriptional regulator with XRE-family HTH domain
MAGETVTTADDADVATLLGLEPLEQPTSDGSEQVSELDAQVGRRVRAARRRAGLNAVALADQVGLTRDKLSKIENGRRRVAPRELPALAHALHVSLSALLGGTDTTRQAFALAHRVAATAPESATSGARARAIEILQAEGRLAKHGALPPRQLSPGGAAIEQLVATVFETTPRTAPEAQRQGRILAEEVRRILELGIAEIGDLPALVEMHFAADVALSPLGEGSDGLYAHEGDAALLVVNTDYPTGRTRFTLAHELGHHLLRDPRDVIEEQFGEMFGTSYLERRVNAFAGHLLLPLKAVTTTLAWLGCGRDDLIDANARSRAALGYLMVRYGVSLPCALSQIVDAGLLTVKAKRELADNLRAGDLVRAAEYLISERPRPEQTTRERRPPARLVTAALEAARAGHVGMNTVAVLLGRADDEELFDEVMYSDAGTGSQ